MNEPTFMGAAGGIVDSLAAPGLRDVLRPARHEAAAGLGSDPDRAGAFLVVDADWLDRLGPPDAVALRRRASELPIVVIGDPARPELRGLARGDGLIYVEESLLPHHLRAFVRAQAERQPPQRGPAPRPAATLRQKHEALLQELRLAEKVQRGMLPKALPNVPGLAFGASLRACGHLAGDFYNAFRLDRERVGLYVGDVMGHGPASALLGVYAMQTIRTKRIEGASYEIIPPAEALAGLNGDLIEADFPDTPFVTLAYGVLDAGRRTLTYSSGGHPPALLLRPGRPAEPLGEGGPLLGLFEAPFDQAVVELGPGDRLVFYSDGIDSVRWQSGGRGIEGLIERLGRRDGRSAQALVDSAMAEAAFDDEQLRDDLTILLAEVLDA